MEYLKLSGPVWMLYKIKHAMRAMAIPMAERLRFKPEFAPDNWIEREMIDDIEHALDDQMKQSIFAGQELMALREFRALLGKTIACEMAGSNQGSENALAQNDKAVRREASRLVRGFGWEGEVDRSLFDH